MLPLVNQVVNVNCKGSQGLSEANSGISEAHAPHINGNPPTAQKRHDE